MCCRVTAIEPIRSFGFADCGHSTWLIAAQRKARPVEWRMTRHSCIPPPLAPDELIDCPQEKADHNDPNGGSGSCLGGRPSVANLALSEDVPAFWATHLRRHVWYSRSRYQGCYRTVCPTFVGRKRSFALRTLLICHVSLHRGRTAFMDSGTFSPALHPCARGSHDLLVNYRFRCKVATPILCLKQHLRRNRVLRIDLRPQNHGATAASFGDTTNCFASVHGVTCHFFFLAKPACNAPLTCSICVSSSPALTACLMT